MEVQTMQGYFKDGLFHQDGRRVKLPEQKMVIINVLNIPITTERTKSENEPAIVSQEEKKQAFFALNGILAGHDVDLDTLREERILSR